MSNAPLSVCVVGGGFTGATAAVACLSHIKAPFRLVMIEGTTSLGRGVAYGSHHPLNLLNVRARDLSIRAGQPAHFLNWAFRQLDQGENQADLHEALAHTFLPRQLFGEYVRQRLFEAVERRPDVAFTVVTATALDVTSDNGRYRIELDRAESVAVDVVILATAYGLQRPYSTGALAPFQIVPAERSAAASSIVLIDSGLTMVDVLLGARRDGFQGKAIIISPRGQLPRAHAPKGVVPQQVAIPHSKRVSLLAAAVRIACEMAECSGIPCDHQRATPLAAGYLARTAARGAGALLAAPSPVLGRASSPPSHGSARPHQGRVQPRPSYIAAWLGARRHPRGRQVCRQVTQARGAES